MALSFPGRNVWDLKFAPGGLVDIEFIAQAWQLVHAPAQADVLDTNTIAALHKLKAAGVLGAEDADTLIASAQLQHALTQVLRIALDATLNADEASPGLQALLIRAAQAQDFPQVAARLEALQQATRAIFGRLMTRT
jgi:glutamate-ammonia-ligase adenylyltransferase